jgi:hypothetical protein
MAKKATQKTAKTNAVETAIAEAPVQVTVPKTKEESTEPKWKMKNRTYLLTGKHTPLTYTLQSRHSQRWPLLWFDEKEGAQLELRYATNQNSPLVKDQKGEATLGHIIFENGILFVPKQKQNLQKLLSLYHPSKDIKYYEFDEVIEAEDDLEDLELEIDALNVAMEMDVDHMEAILRVEAGSKVSNMDSKEIKRDLLIFVKNNPKLFLNLANDENVELRNFAIKAVEAGIISLSPDQSSMHWTSNNKKLMVVPFEENPFSAFASYLKTDEGVEVYKSIEKKLY